MRVEATEVCRVPLAGPGAWKRADFTGPADWTYTLPPAVVDELECALRAIRERGKTLASLEAADFPLPSFERDAAWLRQELKTGRGFVVIRGLPVERATDEEATLLYWGLGAYLGATLPQNVRGDRVYSVRDEGYNIQRDYGTVGVRFSKTTEGLHFHTDSAPAMMGNTPDVVGVLALRTAKSGGESKLVSALTLHNILLEERPGYLARLYQGYHFDRRAELRPGEPPTLFAPVFTYNGSLAMRYFRYYIPKGHEQAGAPLGTADLEPLNYLESVSNREELQVCFSMERGEIQLVSNTRVLHSRTAFEDYAEPDRRRHLVRLWLRLHS